jgi:CRP-like cAMP-binding protein
MGAAKDLDSGSMAERARKIIDCHFRLFSGLDEAEHEELSRGMELRTFAEDDVLLREGDESFEVFFILSGRVKVEIPLLSRGFSERVATLGSGQNVGEFALVRSGKVTARVVAITSVEAFGTNRDRMQEILIAKPQLGLKVYRNLSSILVDRLVDTNLLARNVLSQISLY